MIHNVAAESTSDLAWFKSSYSSGSEGDSCVELATTAATATIHVRDSKNADGPRLAFSPTTWSAFVPYASEG
ncbi:hypothetical protein M2271_005954 [Streptomyces sp. LBL]|uniref:DUF397 domain-containing protein n=1 Tax=Streptomyces sp. LBL TaxID=2940562 RepID=UPI0024756D17|nr:DUF397 domain-containing protein [Streptomyces sp. LBL]MDH6628122.1 hypothetical protein [Streptomyces sp. LBL]